MALSLVSSVLILVLASSATACDRCVHQALATYEISVDANACGYGSLGEGFNNGLIAGAKPNIFKQGASCGACFQMRCKNESICSTKGAVVLVTDLNNYHGADFVLSPAVFTPMAKNGRRNEVAGMFTEQGAVSVEYKRVPCDLKKKNLAVRVQESSRKPNYLEINILYQGGQTEITAIDVAQVESSNWQFMSRSFGAVWNTSRAPNGPLQFRFVVTAGYDGKWIWAKNVMPSDWKTGAIYDTGLQITDVAQEGCSPCDHSPWK